MPVSRRFSDDFPTSARDRRVGPSSAPGARVAIIARKSDERVAFLWRSDKFVLPAGVSIAIRGAFP
jgi:hypothetical protein